MDAVAAYFAAERAESLLFVAVGVAALVAAAVFVRRRQARFRRGLAIPLALVAVIQIVVGSTIWLRTPADVARVQAMLATAPARLAIEEVPRMEAVMRNFATYRHIETGLLVAGVFAVAFSPRASAWQGAGLGLALQAGLMLLLDHFAEQRGAAYLAFLAAR